MTLFLVGLASGYELEMLSRMFFPHLTLATAKGLSEPVAGEDWLWIENNAGALSIRLTVGDRQFVETGVLAAGERENFALARLLHQVATESGRPALRWGVLTGIRPVKLFHRLFEQGMGEAEQAVLMKERYLLSDTTIRLAQTVCHAEREVKEKSLPNGFSLYVSIPFCPARCSYCSFVSQTVEKSRHLMPAYVQQLCREIEEFGVLAKELGLVLQTVYFGGGTPTTLEAEQLSLLFATIEQSFDCSSLLEYTVEAGRPDTIDEARLLACKKAGVNRISVNPQTMDDALLAAVGRKHTSQEVEEAFSLARSIGFESINMDLIAGLPGDTLAGFSQSLERVLALSPENVTVHALTLKRASDLAGQLGMHEQATLVAGMIDGSRERIMQQGLLPYYLYRQKNTVGSLENIGYANPGRAGYYNVLIMDETHTIFAAGAGAVTKLCADNGHKIERIYNFKYPTEYLERYEALKERKERVRRFYETSQQTEKLGD